MGLLDSFMPGESGGIPGGGLLNGGNFSDRLNNPMAQLGLGILANNTGNYGSFGAALGKGGLQAIASMRQQKQLEAEKQLRDIQMKQAARVAKKDDALEAAKEQFKIAHPEYAGAVDLDPTLAVKAAYPGLGKAAADPYYTPVSTNAGFGSYDNRTGKMELLYGPDGQPYVKSTDSPQVRGAVSGAEAGAKAAWKPNTDIPGIVSTDAQVAQGAYGGQPMPFQQLPVASAQPQAPQRQAMPTNNFSTPYPVTLGAMGAPGSTATDRAEGVNGEADVQLRDPRRPNVPVSGIPIQTKTQQAVEQKVAEMNAEAKAKKAITSTGVGSLIDQARGIMTGKQTPTQSGFGNMADAAGAMVGYTPPGAAQADALKTIAGNLTSRMPRMEGPQSNIDVQNYEKMAGDIGNPTLPVKRRLESLAAMEAITRKYDPESGAPIAQSSKATSVAMPLPAKPSALTLKKGTRYMTPKGELTWNGKAFED